QQREFEGEPRADDEIDRAPIDEGGEQSSVDQVRHDRRHPAAIEGRELLAAHLAVGHRELAMIRVAGDVADVGDVERLVGQNEGRQLGTVQQPLVDSRLARVAADEAVLAKTPNVASSGPSPSSSSSSSRVSISAMSN